MKIAGIEGLTAQQVRDEVSRGARFVIYGYCISLVVVTLRRSSDITFVPAHRSPSVAGLGWTVLSFFLGWWGFPWGFVYTPMVIFQNLSGGKDVTREVMLSLDAELGAPGSPLPLQPAGAPAEPSPWSPASHAPTPPHEAAPSTSTPHPSAGPPVEPRFFDPQGAPPPVRATSGRDIGALILSVLSLACCAPLGWIGAALAFMSIREARAGGRPAPGLAIASIAIAGLSTLVLVIGIGAAVFDSVRTSRKVNQATAAAAVGRRRDTLDARTACSLAEAALWDSEDGRSATALECSPPLTNDPVTPALDVVVRLRGRTKNVTVCFARSTVRWYVLSVREHTTCPPDPQLKASANADEFELERAERNAKDEAVFAPNPPTKRPTREEAVEPDIEALDGQLGSARLVVSNRSSGQKPSPKPPFHVPGGDWTYVDLAPESAPSCTVRLGLKQPPSGGESPVVFTDAVLVPLERKQSTCFVEAVAEGFFVAPPEHAARPGRLAPSELSVAVLGQGLVRDPSGGFVTPKRGHTGSWLTTKLFLEHGDSSAEVFFNLDLEGASAELAEKDSSYREDLVALLSRALVDGQ